MEPYKTTVDEWLPAHLKAPRKLRHTAKRGSPKDREKNRLGDCSPAPAAPTPPVTPFAGQPMCPKQAKADVSYKQGAIVSNALQ
jgi:hypothetical protein